MHLSILGSKTSCNSLKIFEMHKRYQCKSFISEFKMKVVECTPPGLENILTAFLSSGLKVVEYTPLGMWWKFGKIYFFMYCPMMHANLP